MSDTSPPPPLPHREGGGGAPERSAAVVVFHSFSFSALTSPPNYRVIPGHLTGSQPVWENVTPLNGTDRKTAFRTLRRSAYVSGLAR